MRGVLVALGLALTACGGDAREAPSGSLVDPTLWQLVDADRDPLSTHRASKTPCTELALRYELGGVEVDTSGCGYASLSQPSALALSRGDPVRLLLWWGTLSSLEPAQGHLAVLAGDRILWETHVAIPGPADAVDVTFESPSDLPRGTHLTLHVHNHGANTWNFVELSKERKQNP